MPYPNTTIWSESTVELEQTTKFQLFVTNVHHHYNHANVPPKVPWNACNCNDRPNGNFS